MCQCSGLLKEKAGYFERLKIFLKVTGLLGTYVMKSGKCRPFESSTRLVSLTAFGGPWHDGGGRGLGGRCSSESRVSEVKTIEGSTRVHFHDMIKCTTVAVVKTIADI